MSAPCVGDAPETSSQRQRSGLAIRTQVRVYRDWMTDLPLISLAPESCTLPGADRPRRVADFADLLTGSGVDVTRVSPTTALVRLPLRDLAAAEELARQEMACCSFFHITTEADGDRTLMTIEVPGQYAGLLDAWASLGRRHEPAARWSGGRPG